MITKLRSRLTATCCTRAIAAEEAPGAPVRQLERLAENEGWYKGEQGWLCAEHKPRARHGAYCAGGLHCRCDSGA